MYTNHLECRRNPELGNHNLEKSKTTELKLTPVKSHKPYIGERVVTRNVVLALIFIKMKMCLETNKWGN